MRAASSTHPTMNENTETADRLPTTKDGSLTKVAISAVVGLLLLCSAAYFGTQFFSSDHYVVDYYPSTDETAPVLVIRWPSRQLQLEPIQLPKSLGDRWKGKQPKRARLRPDTILPAGDVLEYDESEPPGRYLIRIARQEIEVSPNSSWTRGERAMPTSSQ